MDIGRLESVIAEVAHSSSAPEDFMQNELRRFVNIYSARCRSFGPHPGLIESLKEPLEKEYQAYFNTSDFQKRIGHSFWKPVYAGCNAQIEHFLCGNGLDDAIGRMMVALDSRAPLDDSGLSDRLLRYLVGIGYLYPSGSGLVVHPNFVMANVTPYRYGDSAFLTRDIIRCPYFEATGYEEPFTHAMMWNYWSQLVSLSIGGLPEYRYYLPGDFRGGIMPDGMQNHFELGRRLVPQRYIELEPRIEKFDWVFLEEV